MEYLYGIDASLTNTGVAIYDTENEKVVKLVSIGTKHIKKDNPLRWDGERLKHIYDEFMKLREEYPPSQIAMERAFVGHRNAAEALYRVHGIINMVFHDIDTHYYPPTTVKKAVYAGDASKEDIFWIMSVRWDLPMNNYDESDALAIISTYLIDNKLIEWAEVVKQTEEQDKARKEAIRKERNRIEYERVQAKLKKKKEKS